MVKLAATITSSRNAVTPNAAQQGHAESTTATNSTLIQNHAVHQGPSLVCAKAVRHAATALQEPTVAPIMENTNPAGEPIMTRAAV